jgi:hypothetical protein
MVIVLIVALLAQAPAATVTPRDRATRAKSPDACALLTDADVRAALGAAVTARRSGTQEARGLLLSQCYLDTGTPRSVSIAVAGSVKSGGKTVTPRAFWRDQFHSRDAEASERRDAQASVRTGPRAEHDRDGRERDGDGETKARSIRGLGDEAFWSGTRVAGALYVLRGDTFIRVSVGGIGDERERIEKSRALAVAALGRLP